MTSWTFNLLRAVWSNCDRFIFMESGYLNIDAGREGEKSQEILGWRKANAPISSLETWVNRSWTSLVLCGIKFWNHHTWPAWLSNLYTKSTPPPISSCAQPIFPVCRTLRVTTRQCVELCSLKPGSCAPSWRRSRVPKRWGFIVTAVWSLSSARSAAVKELWYVRAFQRWEKSRKWLPHHLKLLIKLDVLTLFIL